MLEYADLATTYASDAYLQAQQLLLADDDRIRRDLLEDLLAGREPDGGSRLAAANAAGLTQRVAVRPDRGGSGRAPRRRAALRHAASSTARAVRDGVAPLVVIRQREIVIVRVLDAPRTTGLARPLERIQAKLAAGGTRLAIGVSTALEGVRRLSNGCRSRIDLAGWAGVM